VLENLKSLLLNKYLVGYLPSLTVATIVGSVIVPARPALAEAQLACSVPEGQFITINNQAAYIYNENSSLNSSNLLGSKIPLKNASVDVGSRGITDSNNQSIVNLGTFTDAFGSVLKNKLSEDDRNRATEAALIAYLRSSVDVGSEELAVQIKSSIVSAYQDLPDKQAEIKTQIETIDNNDLLVALSTVASPNLRALGFSQAKITTIEGQIKTQVANIKKEDSFASVKDQIFQAATTSLTTEELQKLIDTKNALDTEVDRIRAGKDVAIAEGEKVNYQFLLENTGIARAQLTLPTTQELQTKGLKGSGEVVSVKYQVLDEKDAVVREGDSSAQAIIETVEAKQKVRIVATTAIVKIKPLAVNSISLSIGTKCNDNSSSSEQTLTLVAILEPLRDPFGQITGCAGQLLPDYRGFSVGMYDVDPVTGMELGALTPLTTTELPDDPTNRVPKGIKPNIENANPFFVTNEDEGKYSFLFDKDKGQLDVGRSFILLVKPPAGSTYGERRIKLTITSKEGAIVKYTAQALDGKPIVVKDPLGRTTLDGDFVLVEDAERIGLSLALFNFNTTVCQDREIRIDKSSDRAVAEPGDTVVYRLSVKNLAESTLKDVIVTDALPLGFRLDNKSIRAVIGDQIVNVTTNSSDRGITFTYNGELATGQTLNILYGALLTPDSVRGSGINTANVTATALRTGDSIISNPNVSDGPAKHKLRVEAGILSSCGTIIGRVFVDKNFDGEQQENEPGIPNAVIFLQDGNRITTDANGLFSVANVLPGYWTGVLDLTSLPGYAIAPNLKFKERNSQSRLVHLEPSGLVKMNFAVTPAFREIEPDIPPETDTTDESTETNTSEEITDAVSETDSGTSTLTETPNSNESIDSTNGETK
jgi:uncharacterized repeat protein (TIGR01451 family)